MFSNINVTRSQFIAGAAATGASLFVGDVASADTVDGGEPRVVYGSAEGKFGPVVVKVCLTGNEIDSVEVVKHNESSILADSALSRLPAQIVRNQSVDAELVSGATVTSVAIVTAVTNALQAAGVDPADLANSGSDWGKRAEKPMAAQVAVVGGGLAGLTCAARLLESGRTVALIEESEHLGGAGCLAAGFITGAGTRIEAQAGIEDSPELFYAFIEQMTAQWGEQLSSPEVAQVYSVKSAEAVDWLDAVVGADFGDRAASAGIYEPEDVNRVYAGANGGAALVRPLIDLVQQACAEGRASISLGARATSLATDETGAVTGVGIEFADGSTGEYPFAAVVLATGGYSHDTARQLANGYGAYCEPTPSTCSGHGFPLAESVGARFVNMDRKASYGGGVPVMGNEILYTANMNIPGEVWIGSDGLRYGAEDHWYDAHYVWDAAPDNIAYIVFTDNQLFDGCRPLAINAFYKGEYTPQYAWEEFGRLVDEGEYGFVADSAEELAVAAGIDPAAFAATVERYNGFCDAGEDGDFGRETANLSRLEGRFYAVKGLPMQFICAGGVEVTPQAQVVGENGEPIGGLYAAGEFLGLFQYAGCVRGGGGLGGAATWGFVAADTIDAAL